MTDRSRETGTAIESHYWFILWLIPTVERFPHAQKFLLGDRIQNTTINVLEVLMEAIYKIQRDHSLVRANPGIEKLRFFFVSKKQWYDAPPLGIVHAMHQKTLVIFIFGIGTYSRVLIYELAYFH